MKSVKSVFIKVTFMLSSFLISNSFSVTQAQPTLFTITDAETKGDIHFVDVQDGMLVFELNLKNLPAKGSMLQIKDEAGNLIFEQNIWTETYNVRYKIERNSISKISFEVSARKMLLNKIFSVNSWMEERIEVAKL